MAATAGSEGSSEKYLAESLKRFARSIELCDDYLRGYYGLKKVWLARPPTLSAQADSSRLRTSS